jgi:hypothetical protein
VKYSLFLSSSVRAHTGTASLGIELFGRAIHTASKSVRKEGRNVHMQRIRILEDNELIRSGHSLVPSRVSMHTYIIDQFRHKLNQTSSSCHRSDRGACRHL